MGVILPNKTAALEEITAICKSDSGVCGRALRKAHFSAGRLLGKEIAAGGGKSFAVIIIMRAGLPFGLGIAEELENGASVRVFFSTDERAIPPDFNAEESDKIIIADAVIRTGNDMLALSNKLGAQDKTVFAANVIDETGIKNFEGKRVYAVRSSKHSFVGARQKNIEKGRGPDTGDRLFYSDF